MDKLVFNGEFDKNLIKSCCFNMFFVTGQKTTISNDGATIMKLLDIVHPAAKTLVDISMAQV